MPEPGDLTPRPDVLQVLADLGLDPVSFEPIGGYPRWRAGRVTYRVGLADGSLVKVRRVTRPARPTRAAALVRALDDPQLPAPVALVGRVTVERWIEGVSLDDAPLTPRRIEAAADLLGRLHLRPEVPGQGFRRRGSTAPLLRDTRERIAQLGSLRLLTTAEVRALSARVDADLPARAQRGIVHGDLCGGNLVETPDGGVVSIDNERVHISFLDHDLARTWTRWPMPERDRTHFFSRYATWGRALPEPASFDAWCITSAAKSALTLRDTPGTGRLVARELLERLLTTVTR